MGSDSNTDNERVPLLGGRTSATNTNEENTNNVDNLLNFSTKSVGDRCFILCKVCCNHIDITEKKDTFVVKCSKCNEATPIRKAPAKKRYIRCTCNCLLICCETANRIVCPRSNCKKVIDLPPRKRKTDDELQVRLQQPISQTLPTQRYDNCNVICGHCKMRFYFDVLSNTLATCTNCDKVSSVGKEYARFRGVIYLIVFIILFSSASFLIIRSGSHATVINYIIEVFILLTSIFFFFKSWYYFSLKISEIETNSA